MAPSDPCVFFYPSMFLLQWQCSWDHCHTQKLNHCQSDTIQMVLHVEQNLMLLSVFIITSVLTRSRAILAKTEHQIMTSQINL